MKEKYYYVKGKTAWTFGNHFQDAACWEDSLLNDGVPPSASLIEEYNMQSQIMIDDKISTPTINVCENREQILPGEDVKGIYSKVAGLSTSNGDQLSPPQKVDSMSPTLLPKKQHACSICGKTYGRKDSLDCHLRTHSGEKPFVCLHCNKSFSGKGNLTIHLRTHTDEKPFTCDVCHKSFSHSSNLKVHQRVHSKEKPYTCSTCGKSFSQISHLKTHLLTHTNKKPHKCDHCGKRLSDKANLSRHTRTVHTEKKPYSQTCGNRFADSSHRNKHSRRCKSTTTIKEES